MAEWWSEHNISESDIENCAVYYRHNFKQLVNLVASIFPSELKIFRTTNSAWMKWGNFPIAWPTSVIQSIITSPHVVRMFNDIAIQLIKELGYNVKIYDIFCMSWSRPDQTEIKQGNWI